MILGIICREAVLLHGFARALITTYEQRSCEPSTLTETLNDIHASGYETIFTAENEQRAEARYQLLKQYHNA